MEKSLPKKSKKKKLEERRRSRRTGAAIGGMVAVFILGVGGLVWKLIADNQVRRETELKQYQEKLAIDAGRIRLWDVATAKEVRVLEGHRGPVRCVTFSADGKRAVSGGEDGVVRFWDVTAGKEIRALEGHSKDVTCIALSPDGRRAVSGGVDETVRLWDVEMGKEIRVFPGHSGGVNLVSVAADGARVLAASKERMLYLWDSMGQEVRRMPVDGAGVYSLADGRRALVSRDVTAILLDVETGQILGKVGDSQDFVHGAAFAPNGNSFALARGFEHVTTERFFGRDGVVTYTNKTVKHLNCCAELWGTTPFSMRATMPGHKGVVRQVFFSTDGSRLLTVSNDRTLKQWDVSSGQVLSSLNLAAANSGDMVLSFSGKLAAATANALKEGLPASPDP